jgi:SAM-dependent methyltransferase
VSASASEQEGFLRRFHRRWPGVTARALARGRTAAGGSSYDAIVRAVGPVGGGANGRADARIVDLGCGDGALLAALVRAGVPASSLVGLDLSEHELARAVELGSGAGLIQARAQALPLRDGCAVAVVSHLAFTLMHGPDAVAAEVARVLAPGGRFVTVVGGGPAGDDAFAGAVELVAPLARAAGSVPRLGELRARSDAGLASIFAAERGWAALTVDDLPIDLSGSPDEAWALIETLYELDGVPADEVTSARAAFVAASPRWRRGDGLVACTMATRLVVATRVAATG